MGQNWKLELKLGLQNIPGQYGRKSLHMGDNYYVIYIVTRFTLK